VTKHNLQKEGDLAAIINEDSVEFLKRPHLWPLVSLCPLKRRKHGSLELGVVLKVRPLRVYLTPNGWAGTDYTKASYINYANIEDIVADGWEVD